MLTSARPVAPALGLVAAACAWLLLPATAWAAPALPENESFTFGHAVRIIGGLALFLYGMRLASDGLRRAAGARLRGLLRTLTTNRFMGATVGAGVTVLVQSSSATAVMLVSMTNAGLLALREALPVLLGAGIGTTLTVQLVAFRISNYALLAIAAGVLVLMVARSRLANALANLLIGLGLLFFGLELMRQGVDPLRTVPRVDILIDALNRQPAWGLLAGTLFTAVVQSSAATVALGMSLSAAGLLGPVGALGLVLGANIGTTTTALISCIGAVRSAWRLALANFFCKVVGALLVLPWLDDVALLFSWDVAAASARPIANAHTAFNVALALFWLPLVGPLSWLFCRLVPEGPHPGEKLVRFIDLRNRTEPQEALKQATCEIQALGRRVRDLVERSADALDTTSSTMLDELEMRDRKIDQLYATIVSYLHDLTSASTPLVRDLRERQKRLLQAAKDLESIGDVISRDLVRLMEKRLRNGLWLLEDARRELRNYIHLLLRDLDLVVETLDQEVAEPRLGHAEIEAHYRQLLRFYDDRVEAGQPGAAESEVIHTDTASAYRTIHHRVVDMAESLRLLGLRADVAAPSDPDELINWWRGGRRLPRVE